MRRACVMLSRIGGIIAVSSVRGMADQWLGLTCQGVSYFSCQPGCGVMVRPAEVEAL
jgi:hypothetical protein